MDELTMLAELRPSEPSLDERQLAVLRVELFPNEPASTGQHRSASDHEAASAAPAESGPGFRSRLLVGIAASVTMLGVVGIVAVNRTSPSALEISDSVATIDPVGALFVLPEPLDAYDLANPYVSEASSAAGGGTAGLGADGVLLGIEDGTGYADLRTATVYDESPTQHGEWTQVDTPTGPAYTTPGPLAAAAQQYGDQWLVITTFGDANLALDVLDDIRIDDTGEIVVDTEPSDLVVISELTQPSGSGLHVTSYELTTAGQSRITVETGVHDTPLALGAGRANRLEPTEIDGTRAWVATRVDADGPWIGLVWSATPNRIVAVSGHDVSVTEITQVAESLQYVDEATWRQAFSDVTID